MFIYRHGMFDKSFFIVLDILLLICVDIFINSQSQTMLPLCMVAILMDTQNWNQQIGNKTESMSVDLRSFTRSFHCTCIIQWTSLNKTRTLFEQIQHGQLKQYYSGTSLLWTPLGPTYMYMCPHFSTLLLYRFRLLAIDHDILSFVDMSFNDLWPIILITNPTNTQFSVPDREPIGRISHSTHIRQLIYANTVKYV